MVHSGGLYIFPDEYKGIGQRYEPWEVYKVCFCSANMLVEDKETRWGFEVLGVGGESLLFSRY